MATARRGDVWDIDLGDPIGHEQGGERPALVVSVNELNRNAGQIVIICPITGTDRGLPSHVRLDPDEGGMTKISFIKTEDVRAISTERLVEARGTVEPATMKEVSKCLRVLLGL